MLVSSPAHVHYKYPPPLPHVTIFDAVPLSQAQRVFLLNLARAALLEKLRSTDGATEVTVATRDAATGKGAEADKSDAPTSDPVLIASAGCFVSLHEKDTHRLRGCVGRLDPELPLWRVVRETAADVLRDPRFTDMPVTAGDVTFLELEISVLSPPRLAASPLDFEPFTDGIYLIHGSRCGFFLPQVARDTRWSKQQLLNRLCEEKLSLPYDTWRKAEAKLFTFKVEVIGPEAVCAGNPNDQTRSPNQIRMTNDE
jgi:AmmeMemoRadiSam system protein A